MWMPAALQQWVTLLKTPAQLIPKVMWVSVAVLPPEAILMFVVHVVARANSGSAKTGVYDDVYVTRVTTKGHANVCGLYCHLKLR